MTTCAVRAFADDGDQRTAGFELDSGIVAFEEGEEMGFVMVHDVFRNRNEKLKVAHKEILR